MKSGFTLIELSIVLVIIGLIIGGILSGQDLVSAAAQRAQIAQIEKYNTAVRTFQGKYGYLPGDIPDPQATKFGFQSRGSLVGEGDGNGIIEGNCPNISSIGPAKSFEEGCGELAVMWEDLSEANLIDTTVSGYDTLGNKYPYTQGYTGAVNLPPPSPSVKDWIPAAKLGQNIFIYVWGWAGANYFAVSTVTQIGYTITSSANPGLTVQQAYNMDKKIDDGLPQSGSIIACYMNYNVVNYASVYAAGNNLQGANGGSSVQYTNDCIPTTVATAVANTDCFDNGGATGVQTYSLSQNANMQNCALSFRFQ